MGDERGKNTVNDTVAEYVRQVRERLAAGRDEIVRQREEAQSTQRHIEAMHEWLAESERQLRGETPA